MTNEERARVIAEHDRLCDIYNDTEDASTLEEIGVLELVLLRNGAACHLFASGGHHDRG